MNDFRSSLLTVKLFDAMSESKKTVPNSESKQYTALWTPGWYELDQTLVLGERQKFWFFQTPPAECVKMAEDLDFVFYNQLLSLIHI